MHIYLFSTIWRMQKKKKEEEEDWKFSTAAVTFKMLALLSINIFFAKKPPSPPPTNNHSHGFERFHLGFELSVTRFGEISPLWFKVKNYIFIGFILYLPKF